MFHFFQDLLQCRGKFIPSEVQGSGDRLPRSLNIQTQKAPGVRGQKVVVWAEWHRRASLLCVQSQGTIASFHHGTDPASSLAYHPLSLYPTCYRCTPISLGAASSALHPVKPSWLKPRASNHPRATVVHFYFRSALAACPLGGSTLHTKRHSLRHSSFPGYQP